MKKKLKKRELFHENKESIFSAWKFLTSIEYLYQEESKSSLTTRPRKLNPRECKPLMMSSGWFVKRSKLAEGGGTSSRCLFYGEMG
jgi:hypothetical protein